MSEEVHNSKKLVLVDECELQKLTEARKLLIRRVEAEQEQDQKVRLQQLVTVRLDTMKWFSECNG